MAVWREKSSLTSAAARQLVDGAADAAEEKGVAASIWICDESGVQKAFLRMDGAPLLSVQIARDKAYTAAGFGVPTHEWYGMIEDDPASRLGAVGGIERLVILGGGLPLIADGSVAGGIGVSGGTAEQDRGIAEKAMELLGDEPV